jgi:catechol 2,3-dioxygenase-like lactoylglutathione lyase family enzyme
MTEIGRQQLDELKIATARLPVVRCSEIVLQTSQYELMRDWYQAVFGLPWAVSTDPRGDTRVRFAGSPKQVRASDVRACFMFLDPDLQGGQTLAIFDVPGTATAPTVDPGINHLQFKHASLSALIERVKLLFRAGIKAHRCSNHGPITSFYFTDPDLNVVELAVTNFATAEAFFTFTRSEKFRQNPSGIELDAEDFIRRYDSGEDADTLLAIP